MPIPDVGYNGNVTDKRRRSGGGDWLDRTIDGAGRSWWTIGCVIPLSIVAAVRDWWRGDRRSR